MGRRAEWRETAVGRSVPRFRRNIFLPASAPTSYYPRTPPRIGDQQILGDQSAAHRGVGTNSHFELSCSSVFFCGIRCIPFVFYSTENFILRSIKIKPSWPCHCQCWCNFQKLVFYNYFQKQGVAVKNIKVWGFMLQARYWDILGLLFARVAIKSTFLRAAVTSADSRASGFQELSVTTCASNSFFTFILLPVTWLPRSKQIDQNRKFLGVTFSECKVENFILGRLGIVNSLEKKMNCNGPLVQKLVLLAIFTIPYQTTISNLSQCLS